MKTMMKNTICLLTFGAVAIACGQSGSSATPAKGPGAAGIQSATTAAGPVTLTSRYTGGTYTTAAYSFRFMSQDENQTRDNWEILFEAREDFADYFEVNTVVDDNSFIYDLGERSCSSIKSSTPDERKNRPLVWLAYSDVSPSDMEPKKTALVQVGHCYLTYNNDDDGRVVALFHVKEHVKSKTVTIDEVERLDDLRR